MALAYLRSSLSRSLELMAISARKGAMSSPDQRERVRKRSAKRAAGSTGREDAGKYDKVSISLVRDEDTR